MSGPVTVTYSANNSGGDWWLKDKDWRALEAAGWTVEWGGKTFCHSEYRMRATPSEFVDTCPEGADCPGHVNYPSYAAIVAAGEDARWLGTLATHAHKAFASPADAIREFESVTGQSASDEGCNCCGPPHSFSWGEGKDWGYASGDGVLGTLFPGKRVPKLREVMERDP